MALLRLIVKNTAQVRLSTSAPVKSWQQAMCSSTFTMKKVEANHSKPLAHENFEEKNKRLQRPISPHLSAYKVMWNSSLSISHRFAGLAQNGFLYALAIGAMVLPGSFPHYLGMLEAAHMPLLVLAGKFIIAFPFSYHLINGMRHLWWDIGANLTIKGVQTTGFIVLGLAISMTLYLLSL